MPLHCFSNPSKKVGGLCLLPLTLTPVTLTVLVQVTVSRTCLSPLCTVNDEKINTGSGQPQPRQLGHRHTHKHTLCCRLHHVVSTLEAAAVTGLGERTRERMTWTSSGAAAVPGTGCTGGGRAAAICAKLAAMCLKRS